MGVDRELFLTLGHGCFPIMFAVTGGHGRGIFVLHEKVTNIHVRKGKTMENILYFLLIGGLMVFMMRRGGGCCGGHGSHGGHGGHSHTGHGHDTGSHADHGAQDEYAVDPVCGMKVSKKNAIIRQIDGQTYYFCSVHCADSFKK